MPDTTCIKTVKTFEQLYIKSHKIEASGSVFILRGDLFVCHVTGAQKYNLL